MSEFTCKLNEEVLVSRFEVRQLLDTNAERAFVLSDVRVTVLEIVDGVPTMIDLVWTKDTRAEYAG